MSKMQLGVIFGSRSCEHDVSVISAVQLMNAADAEKYDVIPVYITQRGVWYTGACLRDIKTFTDFDENRPDLTNVTLDMTAGSGALITYEARKGLFGGGKERVVARLDCVIPVLHGLHGEDGTLQGMLEMANLPYTSTGVAGSAVGMDKILMKQVFRGAGFPVLPDVALTRSAFSREPDAACQRVEDALPYPVFVKPANLGSSIGVSRAVDRGSLREALALAFSYDRRVLAERGLDQPIELNCSVLGFDEEAEPSVLEMPNTRETFLTFEEKYLSGAKSAGMASLKRQIPAPVSGDITRKAQSLAVDIFRALDCKGVVRVDFMLDRATQSLYITEINTIPGSLAFYLWTPMGVPYGKLIDRMVACALRAHEEKNANDYAHTSDILKGANLGAKGGKLGGKLG